MAIVDSPGELLRKLGRKWPQKKQINAGPRPRYGLSAGPPSSDFAGMAAADIIVVAGWVGLGRYLTLRSCLFELKGKTVLASHPRPV